MKKVGNILWGFLLIMVGLIFGLNALEITDIDIFFDGWWTMFIIVPSFIGLFKENDKTGSIIGLFIGILLLMACQDFIEFDVILKLIVPTILVMVGLSIILKDFLATKTKQKISKLKKHTNKSYCATFENQNLNFEDEKFEGCELDAIFGGIKCDLREATITDDVVITTCCIFGGIDLYVPENVKVKINSTPIFGGVTSKNINSKNEKAKIIYVNATCIFGGVEIK